MIPYRYGIWKPSEGRGHRFESCRVRHFTDGITSRNIQVFRETLDLSRLTPRLLLTLRSHLITQRIGNGIDYQAKGRVVRPSAAQGLSCPRGLKLASRSSRRLSSLRPLRMASEQLRPPGRKIQQGRRCLCTATSGNTPKARAEHAICPPHSRRRGSTWSFVQPAKVSRSAFSAPAEQQRARVSWCRADRGAYRFVPRTQSFKTND